MFERAAPRVASVWRRQRIERAREEACSSPSQRCAGAVCDAGSDPDKASCCVEQATCGDKDGEGGQTVAVSDDDCGTGFIYDSTAAAVRCAGAVCDAGSDPDRAACCLEQATCGDKDGEGDQTVAVSDDDCGTGFIYDSTAAAVRCAARRRAADPRCPANDDHAGR